MAKALGMTRSHYSEFLSGLRGLSKAAMKKAFEIGVSAEVLLQTPKTKREYERRLRAGLSPWIEERAG